MSRALLLLDVDGPLNPYGAKPTRRPEGYSTHRLQQFRVWLNPDHGPLLLAFAEKHDVELVWATTWEHDANASIGPRIGLPELPVITFARKFSGAYAEHWWKFADVLAYAEGRPLAWLDDEFTAEFSQDPHRPGDATRFLAAREGTPTLLRQVSARVGLKQDDLDAVASWLDAEVPVMI